MSRFGEALKNPGFRNALFIACAPLLLGVAGGAELGMHIQDSLTGGWEYGAIMGGMAGGVLASVPAAILFVVIRNVGRHH